MPPRPVITQSWRSPADTAAVSDDEVRQLAVAGWSLSHGFSTLALPSDISKQFDAGPGVQITRGVIALGELAKQKVVQTRGQRRPQR
jgi:hypothetical protein